MVTTVPKTPLLPWHSLQYAPPCFPERPTMPVDSARASAAVKVSVRAHSVVILPTMLHLWLREPIRHAQLDVVEGHRRGHRAVAHGQERLQRHVQKGVVVEEGAGGGRL